MIDTPAFLDRGRPDVPDLVVPRGTTPFYLAGRPVRGRLIRLGALTDALLSRHPHAPVVSCLAGKSLALVAALASGLKFQGSFSLQVKGDGPMSLLAVDCTDAGALRFYARQDEEALADMLLENPAPEDRDLLGSGFFALTIDQGRETERHQGIVDIAGSDLDAMATHYFETSEQHSVWVRLFCRRMPEGWRAAALILERIAGEGGTEAEAARFDSGADDEAWLTATTLARTVTEGEMLDDALPADILLHRLFHEESLRTGQPRALAYGCRCSRAKLAGVLEGFPADDLDHMAESGEIVMTCEFCNIDFCFARSEIGSARD